MKYRILGSTGLNVSVIGIGTWQFGGEWNKTFEQAEVDAMFRRGREMGINLIDTAECYGDHLSERHVGDAIHAERDQWIIATKFGHHFNKPFDRTEPRSPADVQKQLDDSLRALRTDFVDIYQYHSWGDEQFFDEKVCDVLHTAKRAGKIRHLGNSVGNNRNIKQLASSQARAIEVIQIIYNRLDRAPEEQSFPICQKQNLGVLARVPLASGYLSGKYKPGAVFESADVRSRQDAAGREKKLAEVQSIAQTELPPGVDMAQWALAWCLKNPIVTSVIPGCKDVAQVESNAAAAELLI